MAVTVYGEKQLAVRHLVDVHLLVGSHPLHPVGGGTCLGGGQAVLLPLIDQIHVHSAVQQGGRLCLTSLKRDLKALEVCLDCLVGNVESSANQGQLDVWLFSREILKLWKFVWIVWSAMLRAPQIRVSLMSGFSAISFAAMSSSSQPVLKLFTWNSFFSRIMTRCSTMVRKSPRMLSSLRATTRFSLACSLVSPQLKQCPNWLSAYSCSPPLEATLK